MSRPETSDDPQDWHCGGWEGAELTTLRHMASLTFDQQLSWLEGAQQIIAEIHGWEAALLPSGLTVMPRWYQQNAPTAEHDNKSA